MVAMIIKYESQSNFLTDAMGGNSWPVHETIFAHDALPLFAAR